MPIIQKHLPHDLVHREVQLSLVGQKDREDHVHRLGQKNLVCRVHPKLL